MDLAVGAIVEGKVTGITKFGAFVALPEGKSGMVHISEVASSFVNDIKDFLQEGQTVKVKIINIDQAGRISHRSSARSGQAVLRPVSRVFSSVPLHRGDARHSSRRTLQR